MMAGFMKQMVYKHSLLAACFMGSLGSAALKWMGLLHCYCKVKWEMLPPLM